MKLKITNKEFTENLKNLKTGYVQKINDLYALVEEKDEHWTDLKSTIDDYKSTLRDVKENYKDQSHYTLITVNNALRSNLKRAERDVEKLKHQREDMKKLLSLVNFNKTESEFEKELAKQVLNPDYNIKTSKIYRQNLLKNITKINKLMKIADVGVEDLLKNEINNKLVLNN